MAQFRQLETHHDASSENYGPSSPKCGGSIPSLKTPMTLSWKNRTTWYPYLLFLGGLLVFVTLLTAIFRPSFLYSSEQNFLWKRFFLTILFTYLLLLGALYGLYYYAIRL